nr:hypothetical protein [uncultured bacterium]
MLFMIANRLLRWIDETFLYLGREFRWSYLPPLMIYLAAGVQGLTAIVGTFYIKEYLDLTATFLASLAFWAAIPWTLKMPLGHLVDLIWQRKTLLVYLGATLITASLLIMYGVIAHTSAMAAIMPPEIWFVVAVLLAPSGYVLQDVVADAMTVEAVPTCDKEGKPYSASEIKAMHTTMQTLGRVSIIAGLMFVAALNITMFEDVETMSAQQQLEIYADIYLMALVIPLLSISGVVLARIQIRRRAKQLIDAGMDGADINSLLYGSNNGTQANWWVLGGGLVFALFTISMGISQLAFAQEIIFTGSMAIVLFLMYRLLLELDDRARRMLIGTALIIFAFRAVPLPGPGLGWFEIDELGFDQQFLSVLSFIASALALLGMVILRPMMARRSIVFVVLVLTIAGAVLSLPNIGLYYGLHEWTAAHSGGIVDARFIAIIDTAMESPLAQIAMIPMLAWIAQNAPPHLKATFFAVMASFTNLALSASSLGTKYINEIYTVTREVQDRVTGLSSSIADYSQLGSLLIVVTLIGLLLPLLTILIVQRSPLRSEQ